MTSSLRERIAAEAARLMLRGKVRSFSEAKKRAARNLKCRALGRDDVPSYAEIQVQMQAISGIHAREVDAGYLQQIWQFALGLMELLEPFDPRIAQLAVHDRLAPGVELQLFVQFGRLAEVEARFRAVGCAVHSSESGPGPDEWALVLRGLFPIRVQRLQQIPATTAVWTLAELQAVLNEASRQDDEEVDSAADDDEILAVMRLLIESLERITLDPVTHPEGDALYHTLQVFELALQERDWDEDFLLAVLLHDVGLAIDARRSESAAIEALGAWISPRVQFLIENLPAASDYLESGQAPKSLRKHEDWDELVLLARLDRAGRVPGQPVRSLKDAIEVVRELRAANNDFAMPDGDAPA